LGFPKDADKALELLKLAAELQDAGAEYELGLSLVRGDFGGTNIVKAVEWFGLSANQGFAPSQNSLGYALANGFGTRREPVAASTWYRLAISQGNPQAKTNLDKLLPQLTSEEVEIGKSQVQKFRPRLMCPPPWLFPPDVRTASLDLQNTKAATKMDCLFDQ